MILNFILYFNTIAILNKISNKPFYKKENFVRSWNRVIVHTILYLHYFNIWKTCQNRVRFTAYLNWKKDIWCNTTAYPSSVWKNCLVCTIKYASSAKKLTLSISRLSKRYEQHMRKTTQSRKTTIHMIIVCVKAQNLLFVVSKHIH